MWQIHSQCHTCRHSESENFGAANAVKHLSIRIERMQMHKTCTDRDDTLQILTHVIQRGCPVSRHGQRFAHFGRRGCGSN